jgi:hypothetical protein
VFVYRNADIFVVGETMVYALNEPGVLFVVTPDIISVKIEEVLLSLKKIPKLDESL